MVLFFEMDAQGKMTSVLRSPCLIVFHSNWFRSVSGAGCPKARHMATIWPL